MKRRTLIKSGIFAACAAMIGTSGCKKENELSNNLLIPKQTKPYEIYAPMPFRYDLIDEISKLNSQLKKSQIKTFYNNIPRPLFSEFEENFQGPKGENNNIKTFEDFAQYVKYAKQQGYKFVYVLNSPKPFSMDVFFKYSDRLFRLIDKLEEIGCDELKIANQQLINLISEQRPQIALSASTSFEFHNVSQYINLINTYPQIKSINTAIDDNRNLVFFKNLKKKFPKVNIEIMVNEPCIHGCPARICHPSSFFAVWDCIGLKEKIGHLTYFLKSNVVYPWWLPYYQSIGINTFKFFSVPMRANIDTIDFLRNYLMAIENGYENLTVQDFFNDIFYAAVPIKNNVKLTEIMPYLPQMEHFIENAHKCSTICDIECQYCVKNVKEIEKIIS